MNQDNHIYDIAIVGCGPAGLSAAVNAGRRNADLILLGSDFCSPKLYKAAEVNNYLGFYDVTGEELRQAFLKHIRQMGISLTRAKVDNIFFQGDYYSLVARDKTYQAYTIILAVGVSNEKYLEGEERLVGSGVSYCATCDGPLYKGKKVAVIAYNAEGVEEAEYLVELADKVYYIPKYDADEISKLDVEVIADNPIAISGENKVERLDLAGESIEVDGIFIFRDVTPPDKLVFGLELEKKHIKVNKQMETNLPGVYAAGDCTGTPYQLSRAAGQGQIAGLNAASTARKIKEGLKTKNKEEELTPLFV